MEAKNGTEEEKLTEERKKAFLESKFEPKNQKYGLFSYTGTLAISDRPYYLKTQNHKGPDGRVQISPRNFYTNPTKRGKTSEVYFSAPEYMADQFAEGTKLYQKEKINAEKMKISHESPWKPSGVKPEKYSLFTYEPKDKIVSINRKGPDGKVLIGPKNFLTSPPKQGVASTTPGVLFGPVYEFIEDPYDRKHKQEVEELMKHKGKLQSSIFKAMDHGNRFFSDYQPKIQEVKLKIVEKKSLSPKVNHEIKPFYTVSSGSLGCFNKYPEHMHSLIEVPKKTTLADKPSWKSTTSLRTIPSPSISNSIKNLRSEFPSLRRL